MELDKKLVDEILQEAKEQGLDQSAYLVDQLTEMDNLRAAKNMILHQKHILKIDYEAACKKMDEKLAEIQCKCKHRRQSYYGDPAGGSDHYYECSLCGKQS